MASSGVSRLHSHDISNGKVYGMVQATQDVLLCGNRLKNQTTLDKRLLPGPSSRQLTPSLG